MHIGRFFALALAVGFLWTSAPLAQDSGRIEGRLTKEDGGGIGAVTVAINETGASTLTNNKGNFSFNNVPAGTYTLTFSVGDYSATEAGVTVSGGETARVDKSVDWDISFVETITVYSASRRAERIVEAPSAVTIISEDEIEREASHGQLPKLLEFTPGAEVTQSGIYDYNFNTRGFNSSLNRRVATLIDGRDPSVPFLGAQEWSSVSFPLDDIASVEMLRGPSAALYGANASSGVLNITSKQPRFSQGGQIRLAAGELSTTNADLRYATALGGEWYLKVNAGIRDSGDFSVSRQFDFTTGMGRAEYSVPCPLPQGTATDCLPQEFSPLDPQDDDQIVFGGLRVDKYLSNGSFFTIEGGTADIEGPVTQTGIGRVQLVDVQRDWGRFNYSADHWNVLAYYNRRDAPKQTALGTNTLPQPDGSTLNPNLALDTENFQLEVQGNWDFGNDKGRIVVGASYGEEDIDSFDPDQGRQTLIFQPVDADFEAAFTQLDWKFSDHVRLVVAGRWDNSTLHDSQVSPKASVVYSINPNHTVRFTYNEAFQVANYSEFFLQATVALTDLSALNGICLFSGVDCGLGITPVMALGNESLELEEIQTFEVGYTGIIGGKSFLTVDYYNSDNENFITDVIPQVDAATGNLTNPNFGAWVGSAAAENTPVNPLLGFPVGFTVADAVRATAAAVLPAGILLTNNLDASDLLAAVSYTNFGEVDTQGVDVGLNHYLTKRWNLAFSYSWFDFDIKDESAPFANQLLPNTPENKATLGFGYVGRRWDGRISGRWVDRFRWVVGPFQGDVESYTTVDLAGNYHINDEWTVGINVANLLDDGHFESFGGDILERRALAHVAYRWGP